MQSKKANECEVPKRSVFDSAFYQFATGVVAIAALVVVHLSGEQDNSGIVAIISAIAGAGVWGGMKTQKKTPDKSGVDL